MCGSNDKGETEDDLKRSFTTSVWREGEGFVAQCLEVDVASQARTEAEALGLHFTPSVAAILSPTNSESNARRP